MDSNHLVPQAEDLQSSSVTLPSKHPETGREGSNLRAGLEWAPTLPVDTVRTVSCVSAFTTPRPDKSGSLSSLPGRHYGPNRGAFYLGLIIKPYPCGPTERFPGRLEMAESLLGVTPSLTFAL